MFIKKSTLKLVKPTDIIRLAQWLDIDITGRTLEDIIDEVANHTNKQQYIRQMY